MTDACAPHGNGARRSERTPDLFEEHTHTAASRRTRVAFISTLTAFSLERHRENGDDTQTCRISIDVPQMRRDAASAWI